jgi:hypothetical protein
MNLIKAENREYWLLAESINQRNPHHDQTGRSTGVKHGTDFRHAVEFSKSGRARTPALGALVRGNFSMLHRASGGPSGPSRRPPAGGLARRRDEVTCGPGPCQTSDPVTPDTPREESRRGSEGRARRGARAGQLGDAPPRCTPATCRLPRRSTSQPPGSQASSPGTVSASVTRSLLR